MKLERALGIAACLLVVLALVLAFLVIGPPSHARLIALDQQRVNDLDSIASRIHDRFGETPLPARLPSDLQARDPVTGRYYSFQRRNAKDYVLCANFALPAETESVDQLLYGKKWPHGAGLTCYKFNAAASDVVPHVFSRAP